ncbi:MAG: helix-turn-helix domain-containing protein [Nitrososphaeria archaeon]
MSLQYDEILKKIVGDIVLSDNVGLALKSWRERLNVKQVDLARQLTISPAVLSDYESGKRSSPGTMFVKKYVKALVEIDQKANRILGRLDVPVSESAILSIGEYEHPVSAQQIIEALGAKVLAGEACLNTPIYGYTVLDSIKTILTMSGLDFIKIFGYNSERVLVFTKVGIGRSPIVAIRVSQIKPRMVVLHGPREVDSLAIEIAKKECMVLGVTALPNESDITLNLVRLQKLKPSQ